MGAISPIGGWMGILRDNLIAQHLTAKLAKPAGES